jgi:hypothetical protein
MKYWVTPVKPLDPTIRYPVKFTWLFPMSLGVMLLEWFYFVYMVPYDAIPMKSVFWLAFIAWASPFPIAEWICRNWPTSKAIDKYSTLFIVFGIIAIIIGSASRRVDELRPFAYAIMPGGMAGGLTSSNMSLIYQKLFAKKKQNTRVGAARANVKSMVLFP